MSIFRLLCKFQLKSSGFCLEIFSTRDRSVSPVEDIDASISIFGQGQLAKFLVNAGNGFTKGYGEFAVRDAGDSFEILIIRILALWGVFLEEGRTKQGFPLRFACMVAFGTVLGYTCMLYWASISQLEQGAMRGGV